MHGVPVTAKFSRDMSQIEFCSPVSKFGFWKRVPELSADVKIDLECELICRRGV